MFKARLGGIRVIALAACAVLVVGAATADTVTITPAKDNSMFENFDSNESNGAGVYMYSGRTGCCGLRRALMAFDIAGSIPAGSTIDSVSLQLTVSKVPGIVDPIDFNLHPVTADWGEGASDAGDPGGFGAPPEPGDATWEFRFFNTDAWTTPGGDFVGSSGSSTVLNLGDYTWSSAAMAADVQSWLNAPGGNFGWILIGNEAGFNGNARRFNSRENADPATQPQLTVNFTLGAVCGDGTTDAGEQCDDGNLVDGDGCSSSCLVEFCGDGIVQPDEACDDAGESGSCDDDCTAAECGDGTVNGTAGEQCDDGNLTGGDGCEADCTLPVPVPTLSEWGLILMGLLMLTAGTILFGRREVAGAGVGGNVSGTGTGFGRIPFDLRGYRNALALCASLLAIGFGTARAALGVVTAVDLGGSLVALPVVAYLVHLWTMQRRD